MTPERPDISKLDPEIRLYIEMLEGELERLRSATHRVTRLKTPTIVDEPEALLSDISEPAEPPTPINLITATVNGIAKRTPRHLYNRQRRGGMGVFDIETPEEDPPALLALAEESQSVLLLTNQAHAFRIPVSTILETPVRGRGQTIFGRIALNPDETLAAILPIQAEGYLAMVSRTGMVRLLRHHVFGEYMKPGQEMYRVTQSGPLASACWTSGNSDLLIVTRQGKAIRFSEKLVKPAGDMGIRVSAGDEVVAITTVYDDSSVFLLGADGKGTLRQMENFASNKALGAGGKIAFASDHVIAAISTDDRRDVFIISNLSKVIRFSLEDIPPKDGVVQGVICMTLRADQPVAAVLA